MVKAFKAGGKIERELYQKFWWSVFSKAMTATILMNLLMSLFDDDDFFERYQKAWDAGNLRWTGVDITPLYRALPGEDDGNRRYYSIIGHFIDVVKLVMKPGEFAVHKASPMANALLGLAVGVDWKGDRFTSVDELFGVDDKGVYLINTKDHKKGEPKGGQLRGKTTKYGKAGPIQLKEVPSYLTYQGGRMLPIQFQEAIAMVLGQRKAFDGFGRMLGLRVAVGYKQPEKDKDRMIETYLKAYDANDRPAMQRIKDDVAMFNEDHEEIAINLSREVAQHNSVQRAVDARKKEGGSK
jgi:hypothetical protein